MSGSFRMGRGYSAKGCGELLVIEERWLSGLIRKQASDVAGCVGVAKRAGGESELVGTRRGLQHATFSPLECLAL